LTIAGSLGVKKRSFRGQKRIRVYPGQYYDAETGLHYNWHRDYHPGLGRYIESDRWFALAKNLQFGKLRLVFRAKELEQYVYAKNDPVNSVDLLGLLGRRPRNGEEDGYRYGDICTDSLKSKIGENICEQNLDKWEDWLDNPCFMCCTEMFAMAPTPVPFSTEATLICESICIAGLKAYKEMVCCDDKKKK